MAKRVRIVRPDTQVTGIGPEGEDVAVPAVSLEALAGALVKAATVLDMNGGVLTVLTSRAETGFPDERVTSAAMIEWKDRTDARPQPEGPGPDLVAASNGNGHDPEPVAVGAEPAEVDESSVPKAHRES